MKEKKYPELGDIDVRDFRQIWNKYIMPLKDHKLRNTKGGEYLIEKVDKDEITRYASSNKKSRPIPFEKCQKAYDALCNQGGYISRDDILNIVGLWCSSFIVSLLATLPHVEETSGPRGLRLR